MRWLPTCHSGRNRPIAQNWSVAVRDYPITILARSLRSKTGFGVRVIDLRPLWNAHQYPPGDFIPVMLVG